MKTLTAFLNELAEKAGIQITDQKLVDLLAHTELNRITIPDDLESSFSQSLLSIRDAKNNHPEIKRHYFAEIMSNVDRSLKETYDAHPDIFDETTIQALNAEKSSTKRIALVAEKMKEKLKSTSDGAAAGGSKMNDAERAEFTQKINDLNTQIGQLKTTHQNALQAEQQKFKDYKIKSAFTQMFAGEKTIYDNLPPAARIAALDALLQNDIRENGLILDFDDNDQLLIKKSDGSNYFDDNNKQVTPTAFVQKSFSKNKVLVQNDGQGGNQQNQNANGSGQNNGGSNSNNRRVPTNVDGGNGQDGTKKGGNIKSLTQQARESLETGNAVVGGK